MFSFHLVQSANTEFLLMKTHRAFEIDETERANVQMPYRKNQSKITKISTLFLETFTKKNSLQNLTRLLGGLIELGILEIFTTVFLLNTII